MPKQHVVSLNQTRNGQSFHKVRHCRTKVWELWLTPYLVARYSPRGDEIDEDDLLAERLGESVDGEPPGSSKPIRILSDFTIFDPHHSNEMLPPSAMDSDEGVDRAFSAAGRVRVHSEDDNEEEEEDMDGLSPYVTLGAVLRWSLDLTKVEEWVIMASYFSLANS